MSENTPTVGIIMGSDSDWPTMKKAAEACREFGIAHESRVVSAHRTPDDMADYARTAAERGLRVIIAGAGGAAHLPGMVASHTTLPVIGVPVGPPSRTSSSGPGSMIWKSSIHQPTLTTVLVGPMPKRTCTTELPAAHVVMS